MPNRIEIIPNTLSLVIPVNFDKTAFLNSKYIVNSESAVNSLKKAKCSVEDIASHFFMLGMFAKEKLDAENIDLQNHAIDGTALPEHLIIELDIV